MKRSSFIGEGTPTSGHTPSNLHQKDKKQQPPTTRKQRYKIWYHHGETDYEHGSTSEPQPASVPKKKGRLVGLGRRTRSVPPSSAPPPFVDPEVLTAQLKDKDDRISLLETQMAAQQAGYEAQRRLNQQMMEMMQRMYPNEVFPDVPDP
ncbi:hypothetical protein DY000_02013866 [Brassica cretica]|uniref:No apical meristem-associated C-terminal domain-containing protein n=1 Tax=Brassica cretica TaxID=69181 RepID=A0ABQ7CPW9_BRACR|nr:hypothetical protein DY000_02013866 [Brassica cretica]